MNITEITKRTDLTFAEKTLLIVLLDRIEQCDGEALVSRQTLEEEAGTSRRTVERCWPNIEEFFAIEHLGHGLYSVQKNDGKLSDPSMRASQGSDKLSEKSDRMSENSDNLAAESDNLSEVGNATPLQRKPKGFHYTREDNAKHSKQDIWDRMPERVQECFHRFKIPISVGAPMAIALKCKSAGLTELEVEPYITDGLAGMTTDGGFSASNMVSAFLNPKNVRKWRAKQAEPSRPELDLKCNVRNEWTEGVLV